MLEYISKFLLGLILHSVFREEKVQENILRHIILSTVASVVVLLINRYIGFSIGIVIFFTVIAETSFRTIEYKQDKTEVFSELTLIYMSLLGFEIILQKAINMLKIFSDNYYIFAITIITWTVGVVIFSFNVLVRYKSVIREKIIKNTVLNVVLVNLFLFFNIVAVMVRGYVDQFEIIPQIILIWILIIGMNIIYLVNTNTKLRYANDIKKIQNMSKLLEESVGEMKSKEHEYKNHLNVLYCIMQVTDEGELKEKAREYIGNVYEKERIIADIYEIENTIIKAILFNALYKSKINDVEFTYNVDGDLSNIPLDDSEFTVLLTNLLNNAIEESKDTEGKFVDVDIYEEDSKCVIYVKNSIKEVNKELADDILSGIKRSTKGEGRGYGIKNVMNILKSCKGDISIDIVENFIEFVIEIPMR